MRDFGRSPHAIAPLFAATAALLGGGVAVTAGCTRSPTVQSAASPVSVTVVAVDRSGSTEAQRPKQNALIGAVLINAEEDDEEFALWTVDQKANCVVFPRQFNVGERLPKSIEKEVATPLGTRSTRTRPALLWEEMAERYAVPVPNESRLIRIVYLTDGDNDWSEEGPRMAKAIQRLAKNPRVTVALLGLAPDEEKILEKQFAPFGPKRLILRIAGDEGGGLEALQQMSKSLAATTDSSDK